MRTVLRTALVLLVLAPFTTGCSGDPKSEAPPGVDKLQKEGPGGGDKGKSGKTNPKKLKWG